MSVPGQPRVEEIVKKRGRPPKPPSKRRAVREASRSLAAPIARAGGMSGDMALCLNPPEELRPYLMRALRWRDDLLTVVGRQYESLGAIPCALISNAAICMALAYQAVDRGKGPEARGHFGECRSALLCAWSVASKEGGAKRIDPTLAVRQALSEWETSNLTVTESMSGDVGKSEPISSDMGEGESMSVDGGPGL
jgi:hypothetical protein